MAAEDFSTAHKLTASDSAATDPVASDLAAGEPAAVKIYTQVLQGQDWLRRQQGLQPSLACVLGFTETGLIPGISAAGATPADRRFTAIADAEFLINGPQPQPCYPLPPLQAGASPVLISRAIAAAQTWPITLFNAGLPYPPAVPSLDLGGQPATCLSTGHALPLATVTQLFAAGLAWGQRLGRTTPGPIVLAECVVGGTTTALAVLTGLGIRATGKVNSSHPICNHSQKQQLVQTGLAHAKAAGVNLADPLALVAAVGDPMQPVVAGMALSASRTQGVLLAGGTQMLAVYALARALAQSQELTWQPDNVVVGTTRWVAEDSSGDTPGLANAVGHVPLMATQLNLSQSSYPSLRAYEQGFVKEGVGAGGCAIAAHLYQGWSLTQIRQTVDQLAADQLAARYVQQS
jgi:uncharacterized protein (TIGR00303 family)